MYVKCVSCAKSRFLLPPRNPLTCFALRTSVQCRGRGCLRQLTLTSSPNLIWKVDWCARTSFPIWILFANQICDRWGPGTETLRRIFYIQSSEQMYDDGVDLVEWPIWMIDYWKYGWAEIMTLSHRSYDLSASLYPFWRGRFLASLIIISVEIVVDMSHSPCCWRRYDFSKRKLDLCLHKQTWREEKWFYHKRVNLIRYSIFIWPFHQHSGSRGLIL